MTDVPEIRVGDVAERLERLRNELADLDGSHVEILAVTKGFGPSALAAAQELGLMDVGENYAQEMAAKAKELSTPDGDEPDDTSDHGLRFHFIGQLQSKRVRTVAGLVAVWQSVDRLKVARQIATHAPAAEIMVQVNATGEPQKAGCEPSDVAELVASSRDLGLNVTGLMTVGRDGDEADTRAAFALVRGLADELELPRRSMGMTADLAAAVAEGSTMIRVGTGLFGPRPPRV